MSNLPDIKFISEKNDCSIVSVINNKNNKDKLDENICISDKLINIIVDKIETKNQNQNQNNNKNKNEEKIETYKEIRDNMGCDNDICILDLIKEKNIISETVIDKELEINIKPEGPFNSNKWFNNSNIDDIFKQMELAYPNYHHINFQMIDFMDLKTELATLELKNLPENKNKIGCVLNTDVSTGKGIHWFAVFIDLSKEIVSIEFFNSSGNKPRTPVHEWMIKMEEQCHNMGRKAQRIIASQNRHQYSDTECGPYSCFYILCRIQDVPYSYFMNNRIPDEHVTNLRKKIFNKII